VIAAPAVDLKGGRCVQLVGGRPEDERISLPDPIVVAERWWSLGFESLHVVDLDAALGTGSNHELVGRVARATPALTQVGGGLRDDAAIEAALGAGADRVVVGTRAVDDADWLERTCTMFPGRVVVAADVRDGLVLRKGWREASLFALNELLARVDALPLAGILCTDVSREGRMQGIDRESAERAIKATRHPVWISGGIASLEDLASLKAAGAAGVVLGMSLYTGKLDAGEVAARYGAVQTVSTDQERQQQRKAVR
jgi:phosphoribosylformimino-5-aminoimidazole carboxamide ribotide isomerase